MAVKYLGKKKMYEMACSISPCKLPLMKNCEYKFYRGSEWLKWLSDEECDDGWIQWELYVCKAYYSLEKVQYLESANKAISLSRAFSYRKLESVG